MGSTNNKRKALALLTAVATLAGGLTAGTAYAGGEAGNRPGTGGSGAATQFWQYKDDASGSWGPATDINSVSRAMANAGVRMDDSVRQGRRRAGRRERAGASPVSTSAIRARATATAASSRSARSPATGHDHQRMERVRHLRPERVEGQLEQVHRTRRLQLCWDSSL